jgi:hypothetical protein
MFDPPIRTERKRVSTRLRNDVEPSSASVWALLDRHVWLRGTEASRGFARRLPFSHRRQAKTPRTYRIGRNQHQRVFQIEKRIDRREWEQVVCVFANLARVRLPALLVDLRAPSPHLISSDPRSHMHMQSPELVRRRSSPPTARCSYSDPCRLEVSACCFSTHTGGLLDAP